MQKTNNLILVKGHFLCLVWHLMKMYLFLHKFGISISTHCMFSRFTRTQFIWLTMFCSETWLLKLYSSLQSTQIYYITRIWELDYIGYRFFNCIYFIVLHFSYNKFQLQVVSPVKEIVKCSVKVEQVASKTWWQVRTQKVSCWSHMRNDLNCSTQKLKKQEV